MEQFTSQNIKRLLELYPVTSLREQWPNVSGTKEEICFEIAEKRNRREIVKFTDEYLSCCKQHVYIYSHNGRTKNIPEIAIPGAEMILSSSDEFNLHRFLFILTLDYNLVLRDPVEETSLTFLWPVRLDITTEFLIVRFVILEKNVSSYFDGRSYYLDRKSTEEEAILRSITEQTIGTLQPKVVDLHKGIKKLWDTDFIDSSRARFKKPYSTTLEAMDEKRGIKEYSPDLYELVADSPLFNTLFQVIDQGDISVSTFSVDPMKGFITFNRYSDRKGDTDYVVRKILKHN
jgi:hypothetical protein